MPPSVAHSGGESLTVLQTKGSRRAHKIHHRHGKGWRTDGYNAGLYFHALTADVTGIDDLADKLRKLEGAGHCFVVWGELTDDGRRLLDEDGEIRRLKHAKEDYPATLTDPDLGHHWIPFDLDDVPAPKWLVPDSEDSRRMAVQRAIREHLPACFHGVPCVYQWTASAGVKGWDKLRLRLWFWSARPVCGDALKAAYGDLPGIDASVWRTVQPIYTAAPVFKGAADPLEGVRTGKLSGRTDTVSLPDEVCDRPTWEAREQKRREREQRERREALERAKAHGAIDDEGIAASAAMTLHSAVEAIEGVGKGDRHSTIVKACARCAPFVLAGVLDEGATSNAIIEAGARVLTDRDGATEAASAWQWAIDQCDPASADELAALAIDIGDWSGFDDTDTNTKRLPLDEARKRVADVTADAVHSAIADGKRIAIAAGCGTGKSRAMRKAIADVFTDVIDLTGPVAILTPTRDVQDETMTAIIDEVNEREGGFGAALARHRIGKPLVRNTENCKRPDLCGEAGRKVRGGALVICDACPDREWCEHEGFHRKAKEDRHDVEVMTHGRWFMVQREGRKQTVAWSQWLDAAADGGRWRPVARQTRTQWRIEPRSAGDGDGLELPELDEGTHFRWGVAAGRKPLEAGRRAITEALTAFAGCDTVDALADTLREAGAVERLYSAVIIDEGVFGKLDRNVSIRWDDLAPGGALSHVEGLGAVRRSWEAAVEAEESEGKTRIYSDNLDDWPDDLAIEGEGPDTADLAEIIYDDAKGLVDDVKGAMGALPDIDAATSLVDASHRSWGGCALILDDDTGEWTLKVGVMTPLAHEMASGWTLLDADLANEAMARCVVPDLDEYHDIRAEWPTDNHYVYVKPALSTDRYGRPTQVQWGIKRALMGVAGHARRLDALFARLDVDDNALFVTQKAINPTDDGERTVDADSDLPVAPDGVTGWHVAGAWHHTNGLRVTHYGAGDAKGSNAHRNCDTVVLGAHILPEWKKRQRVYALQSLADHHGVDLTGAGAEGWGEHFERRERRQAAERVRLVEGCCTVVAIGQPLQGVGAPDEVIGCDELDATAFLRCGVVAHGGGVDVHKRVVEREISRLGGAILADRTFPLFFKGLPRTPLNNNVLYGSIREYLASARNRLGNWFCNTCDESWIVLAEKLDLHTATIRTSAPGESRAILATDPIDADTAHEAVEAAGVDWRWYECGGDRVWLTDTPTAELLETLESIYTAPQTVAELVDALATISDCSPRTVARRIKASTFDDGAAVLDEWYRVHDIIRLEQHDWPDYSPAGDLPDAVAATIPGREPAEVVDLDEHRIPTYDELRQKGLPDTGCDPSEYNEWLETIDVPRHLAMYAVRYPPLVKRAQTLGVDLPPPPPPGENDALKQWEANAYLMITRQEDRRIEAEREAKRDGHKGRMRARLDVLAKMHHLHRRGWLTRLHIIKPTPPPTFREYLESEGERPDIIDVLVALEAGDVDEAERVARTHFDDTG